MEKYPVGRSGDPLPIFAENSQELRGGSRHRLSNPYAFSAETILRLRRRMALKVVSQDSSRQDFRQDPVANWFSHGHADRDGWLVLIHAWRKSGARRLLEGFWKTLRISNYSPNFHGRDPLKGCCDLYRHSCSDHMKHSYCRGRFL